MLVQKEIELFACGLVYKHIVDVFETKINTQLTVKATKLSFDA